MTQPVTVTVTATRTVTDIITEVIEVPVTYAVTVTILQESEVAVPTTVIETQTATLPVTTTALRTVTRTETRDAEVFWETTFVTTTGTVVTTLTLYGPVTGGMGCELQTAMMYQPASSGGMVWLILGFIMAMLSLLLAISKLARKLKL
jgi:hypothetical protein